MLSLDNKVKAMTIEMVQQQNCCVSCGFCVAVCVAQCITWKQQEGTYYPKIEHDKCVNCGKCLKVCGGVSFDYNEAFAGNVPENFWLGAYQNILSVQAKNPALLENSASGGAVTQIIKHVLKEDLYQAAFLIEGYQYDNLLCTKLFSSASALENTAKSRYLTVSHENAVRYILAHRDEKIVLVGTSCFVHSFLNLIKEYRLNRQNYLLLGLFCDKTMTYNVYEYFKQYKSLEQPLVHLYFKTKKAGGWPGNVRFAYQDGTHTDVPNTERMKVKEYFQPEACLYCLDKLNQFADLSFGDNYIEGNADKKGVSSVVVRTDVGEKVWDACRHLFHVSEDDAVELEASQHLAQRKQNLYFAQLKGIELKVPQELRITPYDEIDKCAYQRKIDMINIGKETDFFRLNKLFSIQEKKNKSFVWRIARKLKRMLKI